MTHCDFCHCRDATRLVAHPIGHPTPEPCNTLTLCEPKGDRLGCVNHVGDWPTSKGLGFLAMLRPAVASLDAFELLTGFEVDRARVAFWRTLLAKAERAVSAKREEEE